MIKRYVVMNNDHITITGHHNPRGGDIYGYTLHHATLIQGDWLRKENQYQSNDC
jgi:hypothetical protein